MKISFKTGGAQSAPSEYESPKMKIIETTPHSVLCSSNGKINDMESGGDYSDCSGSDFE